MSATSTPSFLPPGVTLLGGVPTTLDLAPSISFLVVYALLLPLAVFRTASSASRTIVLLRPMLFVMVRIATFAVRIAQSKGEYGTGLFIAFLILELAGSNIIIEPLLVLTEKLLLSSPAKINGTTQNSFTAPLRLMRVALLVALILGIYCATLYGNQNDGNKLNNFREASSAITLAIVAATLLISIASHFIYNCPPRGTIFIAVGAALLLISAAYRLWSVKDYQDPFSTHAKVLFYVLGSVFEVFVAVEFLAFNLHDIFDLGAQGSSIFSTFRPQKPAPTITPSNQETQAERIEVTPYDMGTKGPIAEAGNV